MPRTVTVETWIWGPRRRRPQWRVGSGNAAGATSWAIVDTAVATHAQAVAGAVASEQAGGISYDALWQENERLKAENEALWEAWSEAEALRIWSRITSRHA